jgi:hypothetical protein
MSAKDKAKELVDKYLNASFNCKECDMPFCDVPCTMLNLSEAKECALICVDELIVLGVFTKGSIADQYYSEVKKEIENL